MSALFAPFTLRSLVVPNRIVVSPMCQYSAERGEASAWHLIHLGSLALSGAGMLCIEATAVEADGRITPAHLALAQERHCAGGLIGEQEAVVGCWLVDGERREFDLRADAVVEKNGQRLVVEIKGYRREDAKEKQSTMDTYWVPGVNHLGTYGRWAFAEFTEAYQIQADFKAKVESEFNKMIEAATALPAAGKK